MVEFINIEMKNFQKFKTLKFNFREKGLTLIEGSNGSGKSTIFEALFWCLFGVPARGSSASSIITYGEKETAVKLSFMINNKYHYIHRFRNHPTFGNGLIIDDVTYHNSKDAQKYIEEQLLKVTPQIFYNTVYLKQYNYDYFLEQTDAKQKDMLQALIDLDILSELESYQKDFIKEFDLKYTDIHDIQRSVADSIAFKDTTIYNLNSNIEAQSNLFLDEEKIKKDLDNTLITNKTTKEYIESYTEEKHKYQYIIAQFKDQREVIQNTLNAIEIDFEIDNLDILIDVDECPLCRQKLQNKEIIEELYYHSQQRNVYKKDLKRQNEDIKVAEDEYSKILKNLISLDASLTNEIQRIDYLKKNLKEIHEHNFKVQAQINEVKEKLKLVEEEKEQLVEQNNRLLKLLKLMDKYKNISPLTTQFFGKDGVRNDIFDIYLERLEKLTNVVLGDIYPNTKILFKTRKKMSNKKEKRKFNVELIKDGVSVEYYSLSGGERKRVSIAIILGLQQLATMIGNFQCNIIIFDEIFDQLDSEGINSYGNYLKTISKESIFIISHKSHMIDYDNLITMD